MKSNYTFQIAHRSSHNVFRSARSLFYSKGTPESIEVINNLVVDTHGHWLPEVDDGPKKLSETIGIIRGMKKLGFKKLIATPHIMSDRYNNHPDILKEKFDRVVQLLSDENMDIQLELAAEYMLDEGFEQHLKDNKLLSLGGKYLLVELCPWHRNLSLHQILFEIQMQGFIPLLAHPERYHYINVGFADFEKLKNIGCFFQLNMLSLTGYYGRKVKRRANIILKKGWFEFAGSDIHVSSQLEELKLVRLTNEFQNSKLI